jgi:hypothetical protein
MKEMDFRKDNNLSLILTGRVTTKALSLNASIMMALIVV